MRVIPSNCCYLRPSNPRPNSYRRQHRPAARFALWDERGRHPDSGVRRSVATTRAKSSTGAGASRSACATRRTTATHSRSCASCRSSPLGPQIRLGDVTTVVVMDSSLTIRSEEARLSGWVYVDARGVGLLTAVRAMPERVRDNVSLPPAYAIGWSGQFEYLGSAAGSKILQRIDAPMIGGMVTAPLLSLFVIPAAWRLLQERRIGRRQNDET